jgi:hypothetical protein
VAVSSLRCLGVFAAGTPAPSVEARAVAHPSQEWPQSGPRLNYNRALLTLFHGALAVTSQQPIHHKILFKELIDYNIFFNEMQFTCYILIIVRD